MILIANMSSTGDFPEQKLDIDTVISINPVFNRKNKHQTSIYLKPLNINYSNISTSESVSSELLS